MYRNKHGNTCWGIVIKKGYAIVYKQVFVYNLDEIKEERIIVKKRKVPKNIHVIHTSEGVPYLVIVSMDSITLAL